MEINIERSMDHGWTMDNGQWIIIGPKLELEKTSRKGKEMDRSIIIIAVIIMNIIKTDMNYQFELWTMNLELWTVNELWTMNYESTKGDDGQNFKLQWNTIHCWLGHPCT